MNVEESIRLKEFRPPLHVSLIALLGRFSCLG